VGRQAGKDWSLQNGAREVFKARVNYHSVVRFWFDLIFQVSVEVLPVNVPEIRAILWLLKG
jgi:hypothetical protein